MKIISSFGFLVLLAVQACNMEGTYGIEKQNFGIAQEKTFSSTLQESGQEGVDIKLVSLLNSPNFFVQTLKPGMEISLRSTVQNIGNVENFNQTVFADLILSLDTQLNSTDIFIQRVKVADDLLPGQIFSIEPEGITCPNAPAGNYFVLIRLDPDNDIDESTAPTGQGELNNTNVQPTPPVGISSTIPRVRIKNNF